MNTFDLVNALFAFVGGCVVGDRIGRLIRPALCRVWPWYRRFVASRTHPQALPLNAIPYGPGQAARDAYIASKKG